MQSHPLVSIVIMCYNQESFISEAIESCLVQTYSNIEICISDDCSTDNTYIILESYKAKYPDIIKIQQLVKNMGRISLGYNMNNMLSMATGKYIARLDGDDMMSNDRIEKQVNFLETNQNFIGVSGRLDAFDNNTGISLGNIHKNLIVNRTTETLIQYGNSIPPCLMFRNVKNLYGDTSLKVMIDWLFYIELSMYGKIGHIQDVIGRYRIHTNNSINKDLLSDHLQTLDIIDKKYNLMYQSYTNKNRVSIYINKSIGYALKHKRGESVKFLVLSLKLNFLYSIFIIINIILAYIKKLLTRKYF